VRRLTAPGYDQVLRFRGGAGVYFFTQSVLERNVRRRADRAKTARPAHRSKALRRRTRRCSAAARVVAPGAPRTANDAGATVLSVVFLSGLAEALPAVRVAALDRGQRAQSPGRL